MAEIALTVIKGRDDVDDLERYLKAFELLNREWLNEYFVVEPHDESVFGDIENTILDPGGALVFVEQSQNIVGCGALIALEETGFEIAKMAVTSECRGSGFGKKIMDALIEIANQNNASHLEIVTNSSLEAAIGLYKSRGFEVTHTGPHPIYERGDVMMRLNL